MALQPCVLSLFVASKCFQVYPASCSDHSWETSTKFSQFPSVYSVRWRPILSFLFFSFSITSGCPINSIFLCHRPLKFFLFSLQDLLFYNTLKHGSLHCPINEKKKKNQQPQMVFFKVNPWLIHVNVGQKPLQYCKVISLQLIKINGIK